MDYWMLAIIMLLNVMVFVLARGPSPLWGAIALAAIMTALEYVWLQAMIGMKKRKRDKHSEDD